MVSLFGQSEREVCLVGQMKMVQKSCGQFPETADSLHQNVLEGSMPFQWYRIAEKIT